MSKADLIMARAEELRPRTGRRLAVLVPCFNEEAAIAKVVADFRAVLPEAAIYVYDNNSTDRTAEAARAAGALVRREMHQGKGNVVRRMFADVDAETRGRREMKLIAYLEQRAPGEEWDRRQA